MLVFEFRLPSGCFVCRFPSRFCPDHNLRISMGLGLSYANGGPPGMLGGTVQNGGAVGEAIR